MQKTFSLKVDDQGRVALPSEWREVEGVSPCTELFGSLDEFGRLCLETRMGGMRRAQAMVQKYIPKEVSLVDELLEERRREAEREWES